MLESALRFTECGSESGQSWTKTETLKFSTDEENLKPQYRCRVRLLLQSSLYQVIHVLRTRTCHISKDMWCDAGRDSSPFRALPTACTASWDYDSHAHARSYYSALSPPCWRVAFQVMADEFDSIPPGIGLPVSGGNKKNQLLSRPAVRQTTQLLMRHLLLPLHEGIVFSWLARKQNAPNAACLPGTVQ